MAVYRISGLTVESDAELPGATVRAALTDLAGDVQIRRTSVPEEIDNVAESGPNWMLDKHRFLLRVPGVGRLLVSEGTVIEAMPDAGIAYDELVPFVLSTGWGALVAQRGLSTFHAAVIADKGQAIALCGPGGTGKSTLAAALCLAGGRFVCDDMAVMGTDSFGRAAVWPDGQCMQLFGDAISGLGLETDRLGEIRKDIGKHHVKPPGEVVAGPVPLVAIYRMESPRPRNGFRVEEMSALEAAQELLTNSYRRRITLAFAGDGWHVRMTAAVLRQARMFRLNSPLGLDCLSNTADQVLAHWRGMA